MWMYVYLYRWCLKKIEFLPSKSSHSCDGCDTVYWKPDLTQFLTRRRRSKIHPPRLVRWSNQPIYPHKLASKWLPVIALHLSTPAYIHLHPLLIHMFLFKLSGQEKNKCVCDASVQMERKDHSFTCPVASALGSFILGEKEKLHCHTQWKVFFQVHDTHLSFHSS